MSLVLAQITMNAGDGIPGSTIKYHLKQNASLFDKIVVVDGQLTDKAKEFYSQFGNIEVVDSPWEDSYVKQYRAWSDKLKDGDWCLYLDCDEMVSEGLKDFLLHEKGLRTNSEEIKCNTLCLPCVLHLTEDGKRYYPVEGKPKREYEGQWMKNILVKKDAYLDFKHFGSHVIPTHNKQEKGKYIPYPYLHMKSLESFVWNDALQAFLHPEGQHYNAVESRMFKMFVQSYKTTHSFKDAIKNGTWPPPLRKFAWDKRKEVDRPISRLSWVYYVLEGNPMPAPDDFMTWENVKQYVLGKDKTRVFEKNKKEENFIEVING